MSIKAPTMIVCGKYVIKSSGELGSSFPDCCICAAPIEIESEKMDDNDDDDDAVVYATVYL
jgi:hypothetical protein